MGEDFELGLSVGFGLDSDRRCSLRGLKTCGYRAAHACVGAEDTEDAGDAEGAEGAEGVEGVAGAEGVGCVGCSGGERQEETSG